MFVLKRSFSNIFSHPYFMTFWMNLLSIKRLHYFDNRCIRSINGYVKHTTQLWAMRLFLLIFFLEHVVTCCLQEGTFGALSCLHFQFNKLPLQINLLRQLMEDFHPVVHPLLDHLCLSVSQCKQGERSSLVFFFPARGFSIHESFQDRWDMQSLQHVLGITGVSRTFPKRWSHTS